MIPEGSILAHVGRVLAIAERIDRDRVALCYAASGQHAHRLRDTGLPVEPIATLNREDLLARLHKGGSAFTVETLREYVADEIALLKRIKPDAVVGDFRSSLGISTEVCGVPYIAITNAVWTRHLRFPLDPPESWLPTRLFGKRLLRRLAPVLEKRVFKHYAAPFDQVRREHGLEPVGDIRDCMCSRDLTLVPDSDTLFPHRDDMPAHSRYVGPILWEPDLSAPDWLDRLDPDRPLAYVTMGSTGPVEAIRDLARALSSKGIQAVCTTASASIDDWPADCYGDHYLPGRVLCDRADVVVCHAGNGTIYQALSSGCPIVGLPEFHDQEFNMQRVEALDLGRRVPARKRGRPAAIVEHVREVLRDLRYRENARAFQQRLQGVSGAEDAASRITQFAVSHQRGAVEETGAHGATRAGARGQGR